MATLTVAWAVGVVVAGGLVCDKSAAAAAWTIPTTPLSRASRRCRRCSVRVAAALESTSEPNWSAQFRSCLDALEQQGAGTFAKCREMKEAAATFPHMEVKGLGLLGFPFMTAAVEPFKALSTPAISIQEKEAILDPSACKAWQIDADQVTFESDEAWNAVTNDLLTQVNRDLGVSNDTMAALGMQAKFSKLLLCESGGQFFSHVGKEDDTVFGTMIIQLPRRFTGGDLTLSNGGETTIFALSDDCTKQFKCVAFYSGCDYQVHPVTNGIHLCLAFDLLADSVIKPSHSNNLMTTSKLRSFASSWKSEEHPLKVLGYPLEYRVDQRKTFEYYRRQHVLFGTLTGHDEIVFETLKQAKSPDGSPPFHIELVLIERWIAQDEESGEAYPTQCYDSEGNRMKWDSAWDTKVHDLASQAMEDLGIEDQEKLMCHTPRALQERTRASPGLTYMLTR
jgi:hypothetical protein